MVGGLGYVTHVVKFLQQQVIVVMLFSPRKRRSGSMVCVVNTVYTCSDYYKLSFLVKTEN
jgi:hypothetical protein